MCEGNCFPAQRSVSLKMFFVQGFTVFVSISFGVNINLEKV